MLPRHSVGPCMQVIESSEEILWGHRRVRWVLGVFLKRVGETYVLMKESRKSTLSTTFSMAGTTSWRKQSRASGHLDMMCASRGTRVAFLVGAGVDLGGEVGRSGFEGVKGWMWERRKEVSRRKGRMARRRRRRRMGGGIMELWSGDWWVCGWCLRRGEWKGSFSSIFVRVVRFEMDLR